MKLRATGHCPSLPGRFGTVALTWPAPVPCKALVADWPGSSPLLQDTLLQYLMLVAGFTAADNAVALAIVAVGSLLCLTLLLRVVLAFTSETGALLLGLAGLLVEMLLFSVTTTRWMAFLGLCYGATGALVLPAVSSIKSSHAAEDEQVG